MMHTVILAMHVAAGVLGALFGPLAIAWLARGRTGWLASAYHLSVGLVCLSAIGLAALDPARLWWFVLIAAGSYAFSARGMAAIRSGRPGWSARAVRGFGGAYIALWTAIAVVSLPGQPLAWAVPTVVGTVVLERFAGNMGRRESAAVDRATAA